MLRTLRTIYCATRIAVAFLVLATTTAFAATLSTDPANVSVPAIERLSEVVAFAERDDVPDAPPVVSASERTALADADDELWYISSRAARHAPDSLAAEGEVVNRHRDALAYRETGGFNCHAVSFARMHWRNQSSRTGFE